MLSLYWIPLILNLGIFIGMVLTSLFAGQDRNDEAEAAALELQLKRAHLLNGELKTGHH